MTCRPYPDRAVTSLVWSVLSSGGTGGELDHLQETEILCVCDSCTYLSSEEQF